MTATVPRQDARAMAWQFIAPAGARPLFVLGEPADGPDDAITVPAAQFYRHLAPAAWPAVAAPDVATVVAVAGAARPATTVELLGRQVMPGGWLLLGAANAWYPGGGAGALSLSRVRRALAAAGLKIESLYLTLPDHRHPAVLVAAWPAGALDQVLYRLPATYVDRAGRWTSLQRWVRRLMVSGAGAAPHALRVRLAPGYLVVARRPT